MKIVVTGSMPFSAEQLLRLQQAGPVTTAAGASSGDEWLTQVEGADVVCSDGTFVAANLERLHDVFLTFPFVEIGSFDTEALAGRNVMVANARGSNRDSVVEWAVFMALSLLRRFPDYVNADRELRFERGESLAGQDVCVIGAGDIGSHLGKVLAALRANVRYPSRDDDLMTAVKGCQLIVNSLSSTPSSAQLLDRAFFRSLEPGRTSSPTSGRTPSTSMPCWRHWTTGSWPARRSTATRRHHSTPPTPTTGCWPRTRRYWRRRTSHSPRPKHKGKASKWS
jgi:phosphoglycerate dehydrogenase-like enzyme